jgi:hypothetical protein
MRRPLVGLFGGILVALAFALPASAFTPQSVSATRALDWIQQTQLGADGSVGGDATRTEETIWGLVANHRPVPTFVKSGSPSSPIDYLAANVAKEEAAAGNIAQLILAVVAAGQDPSSFGPAATKHDLLRDLQADYNSSTGEYGADKVFDHIMAILAVRGAGESPPAAAITFLKRQQQADGGWSFDNANAFGTDTNTTALALVALVSTSSLDGCTAARALSYLKAAQQPGGGFPAQAAFPPSDPDSDAIVIEGLLAIGQDPTSSAWTKSADKNPLTDLLSFQQQDGSFTFPGIGPDNLLATTQPLVALGSVHLPLTPAGTSFSPAAIPECPPAASPTASSIPTPAASASSVALLARTGQPPAGSWPAVPSGLMILGLAVLGLAWRVMRRATD